MNGNASFKNFNEIYDIHYYIYLYVLIIRKHEVHFASEYIRKVYFFPLLLKCYKNSFIFLTVSRYV